MMWETLKGLGKVQFNEVLLSAGEEAPLKMFFWVWLTFLDHIRGNECMLSRMDEALVTSSFLKHGIVTFSSFFFFKDSLFATLSIHDKQGPWAGHLSKGLQHWKRLSSRLNHSIDKLLHHRVWNSEVDVPGTQ